MQQTIGRSELNLNNQYNISVIIPTYNRQHTLKRAIDSVLLQTYPVKEIIIIDDGSTDDSEHLIKHEYPSLRYLYQPNTGVSAARNLGITSAKHQWIALLDSDDSWHPKKIAAQLNALQQQPDMAFCHTNEIWYRHDKRVNQMQKHQKYGGDVFQHCLERCMIAPSSVLIAQSLFADIGLFDETLPACEDYDLWLRITAKYSVLYLDQPLTIKYGGHSDQLSQKYPALDQYRIQALLKMLSSNGLNVTQHQQTHDMLIKKASIYLNGAKKRHKLTEIDYYQQLINEYQYASEN